MENMMLKFRRSRNSDKTDARPHPISIPQKDPTAILAPKKVIKAVYDYQPQERNGRYLSFTQGDFLHVIAREDDPEWYEACNPLQGSRGLVPVRYFETVGKTARHSGSSQASAASHATGGHDSGYAEKSTERPSLDKPSRLSKSMGKGSGAMVYGVVQFDFKAERPDELDAKAGEAIIVIAQSNPEWFVAKPITRLGGPGLIPVSFVEIRDMGSNRPVPNPQEAVQRAGVPKVEEWKKMAADYKNSSIPLGRLDTGNSASIHQGMERLSVGNNSQHRSESNGYHANGYQTDMRNLRGNSAYQASLSHELASPLLAPVQASVTKYCFADDNFWFIVEAIMEDGRHWQLARFYKDFYDLQVNLLQKHPYEAGEVEMGRDDDGRIIKSPRTIPLMPGPVTWVTDGITSERRGELDKYIKALMRFGPHIKSSRLVREFFEPRKGDHEVDPDAASVDYRLSAVSQQSSASDAGYVTSSQPSSTSKPPAIQPIYPTHNRGKSSLSTLSPNYPYNPRDPPLGDAQSSSMLRQNSAQTSHSHSSANTSNAAFSSTTMPTASSPQPPQQLKIKVRFPHDNTVFIRLPTNAGYADLESKIRERWAQDNPSVDLRSRKIIIDCKDDAGEAGEGWWRITGDEELKEAVKRSAKLTLKVGLH